MALVLAGIDEAGYGPMLGPLCVGLTVFQVRDWTPGDEAPDLWSLLNEVVTRAPGRRSSKVPIADSKILKLANSHKTRHPLVHLERGVLAFLRAVDREPPDDAGLFQALGAQLEDRPWYGGDPAPLPVGQTAGEVAIGAAALAGALERAGVELLALRCEVVGESEFNEIVGRTGTKAEATAAALGRHLATVLSAHAGGDPLRVVCDRLGGRIAYGGLLERFHRGGPVVVLEESESRSRYGLGPKAGASEHQVVVQFMPEAESAHLPVALASMVAKYVRELAMARFNRYWCGRIEELKPTAGYVQDARRWLTDAAGVLTHADRAAMVRRA